MKYIKSILLFALAISLFSTCKKEGPQGIEGPAGQNGSGIANPALYTKWEVISGLSGTKYAIIKSDNIYYQLDSAALGFKSLDIGFALVTGTQIFCWDGYNYTISNDTLKLTNTNGTVILKKNSNAPDETQWVTIVTEIDSIDSPIPNNDGREDLGFDGTNILWTVDGNSDTIYKINPSTHSVSGKIPLSTNYYYGQINYAASNIWLSNYNIVDKINPTTGAVISSSPTL